ncbi:MAG TPA: hypothetical protein VGB13_04635 [Candidatus Krumholzibacteria bacterium]
MITTLVLGVLVGMVLGAGGLTYIWLRTVRKPEHAVRMLAQWWKTAHPHWCQISEDDSRRACPCCGWSEARGERARRGDALVVARIKAGAGAPEKPAGSG